MSNTPKVVDREALKEFRKKTDQRYVLEGEYSPNTRVGESDLADNMTPYSEQSGSNDTTPFVFQSSGGSSDIGSLAYLKALRGNTVVFNQIISDNFDTTGYWARNRLTMTVSGHIAHFVANSNAYSNVSFYKNFVAGVLIKNHKYLMVVKTKVNSGNLSKITFGSQGVGSIATITNPALNIWYNLSGIFTQSRENDQSTNGFNLEYAYSSPNDIVVDTDNFDCKEPQLFDLTQMFGAGNEPTTVEEFVRMFPKPYYAYNAGELLSCKVNGYKTVGYNAFDGEWLQGKAVDSQTGNIITDRRCQVSKNYIKVIPGQKYSFELQGDISGWVSASQRQITEFDADFNFIQYNFRSNTNLSFSTPWAITLTKRTRYILIGMYNSNSARPNNDFTIHLTWDGTRTGYEPYETKTYPMPNVELKSAGSVYDELKPDGTLIRRIGVVDLGTLNWEQLASGSRVYFRVNVAGIKTATSTNAKGNLNCALYQIGTYEEVRQESSTKDKVVGVSTSTNIAIYDSSKASLTAEQFKTAMSGVMLYYELATPTESEDLGFQEITPIDDWGTQEFLYEDTISIPVPQGNEFFYPVDYKAFIDSVGGRDDIEYDAKQLVSLTQLNNFLKTIAGYDATKTQSLKNVNGTIQWVDEE